MLAVWCGAPDHACAHTTPHHTTAGKTLDERARGLGGVCAV
eukprot:SAG22_NODE_17582_length_302_cov_0.980296_1_plen_40_part_01